MRERSTHLTPTHTRTDPWRSDGSSPPSDFSPTSRPAFKRAVELARSLRSQLLIVHVMGPLPIIGEGYITPETVETLLQSQRHLAQRQLRVLVTRAETAGVRASGLLVETGMPHEQIVRVARRKRADMNRDGHARPDWAHAPLAGECRRPRDRERQMSRPDGPRVISVEQSPTGPGAREANAFEGREGELQHARRARRCRVSRSPRGVVDIPCVLRARARVLPPLSVAIRSRRSRARRPPPGAARCARTSVAAAPRRSR
jgi:hypothetical protein